MLQPEVIVQIHLYANCRRGAGNVVATVTVHLHRPWSPIVLVPEPVPPKLSVEEELGANFAHKVRQSVRTLVQCPRYPFYKVTDGYARKDSACAQKLVGKIGAGCKVALECCIVSVDRSPVTLEFRECLFVNHELGLARLVAQGPVGVRGRGLDLERVVL